jgi:16S rRNA (uracil1498-N3)-methyltransferase
MPRFFVETVTQPVTELSARESRHALRALRLEAGDPVTLFDAGASWEGRIESIQGRVTIRILGKTPPVRLPDVRVAAAAPKGNRLDWMVEKLAELGVREFLPVRFARSVATVSADRLRRLERVAIAASKQSGAPLMRILPERPVDEVPPDALLLDRSAGRPVEPGEGWLLVGPEGGLTGKEMERFARRALLGPTILRIESAAVVAAARRLG